MPDEEVGEGAGQSSLENSERREELTNYEINEKKTSMVSDGYNVESLSIAIVVNKTRLEELLDGNPSQEEIDAKAAQLKSIAEAAVSMSVERGDKLVVNLVEFMPVENIGEEIGSSPVLGFFAMHFGAILNVLGLIVGVILFALLGIRPLLAVIAKESPQPALGTTGDGMIPLDNNRTVPDPALLTSEVEMPGQAMPEEISRGYERTASEGSEWRADLDDIANREAQLKVKLGEFVSQSEQRAATIVKNWLQETEKA